jgi:hypothetical protein
MFFIIKLPNAVGHESDDDDTGLADDTEVGSTLRWSLLSFVSCITLLPGSMAIIGFGENDAPFHWGSSMPIGAYRANWENRDRGELEGT